MVCPLPHAALSAWKALLQNHRLKKLCHPSKMTYKSPHSGASMGFPRGIHPCFLPHLPFPVERCPCSLLLLSKTLLHVSPTLECELQEGSESDFFTSMSLVHYLVQKRDSGSTCWINNRINAPTDQWTNDLSLL